MKNPLYNWLTDEEQKIIFFLIIFGIIGLLVQFTGLVASENPEAADSLRAAVEEDFQIVYNLQTVTKKELISIPGIGEKRADDILFYRTENGFSCLSDLKNVKGIGDATFARLEPFFIPFGEEKSSSKTTASVDKKKEVQEKHADSSLNDDSSKININTATLKELQKIKGVGPSTAAKIIALREELGTFTSIEQLLQVKGIGPKTLEKMKPDIEL